MANAEPLLIAKNKDAELNLLPKMSNRHGLVAGATGTGKTVTLQVIAESLSRIGVPVFAEDIKDDLFTAFAKSAGRAVASQAGRDITRGLLGALLGAAVSRRR